MNQSDVGMSFLFSDLEHMGRLNPDGNREYKVFVVRNENDKNWLYDEISRHTDSQTAADLRRSLTYPAYAMIVRNSTPFFDMEELYGVKMQGTEPSRLDAIRLIHVFPAPTVSPVVPPGIGRTLRALLAFAAAYIIHDGIYDSVAELPDELMDEMRTVGIPMDTLTSEYDDDFVDADLGDGAEKYLFKLADGMDASHLSQQGFTFFRMQRDGRPNREPIQLFRNHDNQVSHEWVVLFFGPRRKVLRLFLTIEGVYFHGASRLERFPFDGEVAMRTVTLRDHNAKQRTTYILS